jgi:hypothetical protein
VSAFDGVKVFSASPFARREILGEEVTCWLEEARRTRPGFAIVDIVVRQSSDRAYHCLSIILFFRETKKRSS